MLVVKLTAVLNARCCAERAESLRIERQQMLQAQNGVGEQATHQAEEQHGERVLLPIVLLARIDAHQPIGQPLQRRSTGSSQVLPLASSTCSR